MFVDNGGALWLSDPTLVIVLLAGAVALIVWCHRWMERGTMPLPRGLAVRLSLRQELPRTLRQRLDARPSLLADARRGRSAGPAIRTRPAGRRPQQAA
jgi:hypothetical protein